MKKITLLLFIAVFFSACKKDGIVLLAYQWRTAVEHYNDDTPTEIAPVLPITNDNNRIDFKKVEPGVYTYHLKLKGIPESTTHFTLVEPSAGKTRKYTINLASYGFELSFVDE